MKHRKLCFHCSCLSGRKSVTNNHRNEAFFKDVRSAPGNSAFPNASLLLNRDSRAKEAEDPSLTKAVKGKVKALGLLTSLDDSKLMQLTTLAKVAECS